MVNPGFLPMRAAQKFMRPVKEMREGFMLSTEGQQGWQQTAGVLDRAGLQNLSHPGRTLCRPCCKR